MEARQPGTKVSADLQQPAEDLLHGTAAAIAVGAATRVQRLGSGAQHQIRMPLQQSRVPEANAQSVRSPMHTLHWQSDLQLADNECDRLRVADERHTEGAAMIQQLTRTRRSARTRCPSCRRR